MAGKITAEEKAERVRQRAIEHAKQFQLGTYTRKFVAPVFQQMIRAEAATKDDLWRTLVIVNGELGAVFLKLGFCACVTCGKSHPWKGGVDRYSGMHTGHFLASRRNSILFDEDNVAPQCVRCNIFEHGAPQRFRMWMEAVRGREVIERLEALKTTIVEFSREQLVDMRIAFKNRLDAAIAKMKGSGDA